MSKHRNRGGRPPISGESKASWVNVRLLPSTRRGLELAARRSGRSLSQEAALRLELSLALGTLPTASEVFGILQAASEASAAAPPVTHATRPYYDYLRRVVYAAPGTTSGRLRKQMEAEIGPEGMAKMRKWLETLG
jgi:hypothetical protein